MCEDQWRIVNKTNCSLTSTCSQDPSLPHLSPPLNARLWKANWPVCDTGIKQGTVVTPPALRCIAFRLLCHSGAQTGCITAWYGNCSASDCKAIKRVVHMAQYIKHPAIQYLYTRLSPREAQKNCWRLQPPSHTRFSLLPHSKRYRGTKSSSKKLLNSSYP
jgi:hypothetical protein